MFTGIRTLLTDFLDTALAYHKTSIHYSSVISYCGASVANVDCFCLTFDHSGLRFYQYCTSVLMTDNALLSFCSISSNSNEFIIIIQRDIDTLYLLYLSSSSSFGFGLFFGFIRR